MYENGGDVYRIFYRPEPTWAVYQFFGVKKIFQFKSNNIIGVL
jgi:hypothetical protein